MFVIALSFACSVLFIYLAWGECCNDICRCLHVAFQGIWEWRETTVWWSVCVRVWEQFILLLLDKSRSIRNARIQCRKNMTRLRIMHKPNPMTLLSMWLFLLLMLQSSQEDTNGVSSTDSVLGPSKVPTELAMIPLLYCLHPLTVQMFNRFINLAHSLRWGKVLLPTLSWRETFNHRGGVVVGCIVRVIEPCSPIIIIFCFRWISSCAWINRRKVNVRSARKSDTAWAKWRR